MKKFKCVVSLEIVHAHSVIFLVEYNYFTYNYKFMNFRPIFFLLLFLLCDAFAAHDRKNVVLIIADDLGYGDISFSGATTFKTPNIDSLANKGIVFSNGYATASTCTPSRYSMFTGEYAWRQKKAKTGILAGDDPLCVPTNALTLPKIFKSAGYATCAVGKWHLGLGDGSAPLNFNAEIRPNPNDIGFDSSFIIPATVDRVPTVWLRDGKVVGLDPKDPIEVSYNNNISDTPTGLERPDLLKQGADKQHSCSIINGISRIGYMCGGHSARFVDEEIPTNVVREASDFIEKNKNRPFFLYVGLFEPHVPRTVDPKFAGTSECGIRGDAIVQADWQVGEIVKSLRDAGVLDNTIIIFSSDNGPVVFDGYYDNSERDLNGHKPAGIFRGGKYNIYDGGMRVPFIVVNPDAAVNGLSSALVGLNDLPATFAEMLHVKIPEGEAIDSASALRNFTSAKEPGARKEIVLQGTRGKSIRIGDWKFVPKTHGDAADIGSGANPRDKRFADAIVHEDSLYNLKEDPSETRNVISQYPEIVKTLKNRLLEIEKMK